MEFKFTSLEKKDNPLFYGLLDEYDSLIYKWHDYLAKTFKSKRQIFFPFKFKRELKVIAKNDIELLKKFYDWRDRTHAFCMNPYYIIEPVEKYDLVYLHATAILRDLINYLESVILQVRNNFTNRLSEYENQRNFAIAIGSFILSFAGLIWGIITFMR
jgi:hypothetical protein